MKINLYLMLLISVILLQSCAGKIKTVAVPSLKQKVDYEGTVISEKKHTVSLRHYTELKHEKHKIIFNLFVENRGREPLNINSDNISVVFREKGKDSDPNKMEIQPLDDFMRDLKKDYLDAECRMISEIYSRIDQTLISMEFARSFYALQDIARTFQTKFYNLVDNIYDTDRAYDLLEYIVPPLVYKPQTVLPGCTVTGLIIYDTGDIDEEAEGEFNVVISVDDENHEFIFSRSGNKKEGSRPVKRHFHHKR